MTIDELEKIPFHFVSHLSMTDMHCTTYMSDDKRFGFSDHVPYKDGHPDRRNKAYRSYMINGKWYQTKKKFLEALADVGIMEVLKGGKQ